ncbi:MAG TPA: type II toxin-antitoxin system ParD family antitoxin [Acidisarcina sp.]
MSLPDELDRFVMAKVEEGNYADANEVVLTALRNLEREEREFEVAQSALRADIQEGLESGLAEGDPLGMAQQHLRNLTSLTL